MGLFRKDYMPSRDILGGFNGSQNPKSFADVDFCARPLSEAVVNRFQIVALAACCSPRQTILFVEFGEIYRE
jgi:hypothetical protein